MRRFIELFNTPGFDRLCRMFTLYICLFLLGSIGIYCLVTAKAITGIEMILTALITTVTTIIGFDWGSSAKEHRNDKEV